MTTLDLYHHTDEDAARAIMATGRFITRENTSEAFVPTHVDGQAAGYGPVVIHVRVDEDDVQLDDEFPSGEQHYRIPLDRAEIVEAFTVMPEGERVPLTVSAARAASFPVAPQTRNVETAAVARSGMRGVVHRGVGFGW